MVGRCSWWGCSSPMGHSVPLDHIVSACKGCLVEKVVGLRQRVVGGEQLGIIVTFDITFRHRWQWVCMGMGIRWFGYSGGAGLVVA